VKAMPNYSKSFNTDSKLAYSMTMKKLLGISLGLVMLLGSVPFGDATMPSRYMTPNHIILTGLANSEFELEIYHYDELIENFTGTLDNNSRYEYPFDFKSAPNGVYNIVVTTDYENQKVQTKKSIPLGLGSSSSVSNINGFEEIDSQLNDKIVFYALFVSHTDEAIDEMNDILEDIDKGARFVNVEKDFDNIIDELEDTSQFDHNKKITNIVEQLQDIKNNHEIKEQIPTIINQTEIIRDLYIMQLEKLDVEREKLEELEISIEEGYKQPDYSVTAEIKNSSLIVEFFEDEKPILEDVFYRLEFWQHGELLARNMYVASDGKGTIILEPKKECREPNLWQCAEYFGTKDLGAFAADPTPRIKTMLENQNSNNLKINLDIEAIGKINEKTSLIYPVPFLFIKDAPFGFAQVEDPNNNTTNPQKEKKISWGEKSIRNEKPVYLPARSGIAYELYDEKAEKVFEILVMDLNQYERQFFDPGTRDYRPEMKAKAQSFGIDTTKPMIDYESQIDPYTQRDVYFLKKYLGQTMSPDEIGNLYMKFGLIFNTSDPVLLDYPDFVTVLDSFPPDEELAKISLYPQEMQEKLNAVSSLRWVTILAPIDKLYELEKLDYYGFIKSSPMQKKARISLDEVEEIKYVIPTHLQYNPDRFVSPKQQIANGVLPFAVQCNEGLELAMKHDNSSVCVSVDSIDRLEQRNYLSEKMNWQVIETFEETVQINYDFPLSSKDYPQVNANSEPSMYFGEFDVTLTNLPEVGETAEVIVNFVAEVPIELEGYKIGISLSDEFEFVDVPEDEIIYDTSILSKTAYHKPLDIAVGESAQLSATIKAVKEGMGAVYGFATSEHTYRYGVFVGEEPMLREDYYELYPELEPTMEMPDPSDDVEPTPKEHPAPRPETEPETSSTNSTSPSNPTDDEIREEYCVRHVDQLKCITK